ncbi:MAG: GNAT family N-acetyltransferase [Sphingomonas sp.]|uniref:GNAT family N-acetyltransferase n=1 Tax=Sphingomonas sp. TaxID=28214 RepID=UPI003567CF09
MHLRQRRFPGAQLTRDDIVLRPETAEDEAFLRRLNIAVRWNEFAALPLPADQKVALLQQQYDARRSGYRADYPHADFQVVERSGAPIGRFYVNRGKRDHLLVDIAILPEHHGQGVGAALLDIMLAGAERARATATLRVDHFNPAKRLYQRKGFVEIEDLGLDALMRWTAPS